MKLIKKNFWCSRRWRRSWTDSMYKIDNPFVRVGPQLLFNKVCSKKHGLPCRGLATSIRGCNIAKTALESQGVVWYKQFTQNTHTHYVGKALQLLFYKLFCKAHGLARRGFQALGVQPETRFFSNIHENHSQVMIFNCSKFHWNWSNVMDFYSGYTHTHWLLYVRFLSLV
jgi:hypothetical protein